MVPGRTPKSLAGWELVAVTPRACQAWAPRLALLPSAATGLLLCRRDLERGPLRGRLITAYLCLPFFKAS